jgi:hypothetical protein
LRIPKKEQLFAGPGVFHPEAMTHPPSGNENGETALGDLLREDAARHPVEVSPWFAARTTALATASRRKGRLWSRWFLPIPLAALCALVLVSVHNGGFPYLTGISATSEAQFEQDMELLIADLD